MNNLLLLILLNISFSQAFPTSELLSVAAYEARAQNILTDLSYNYYHHGAFDDLTINSNNKAFHKYRIRPNYIVDVSNINTTTTILGSTIEWPVGVAPTGHHKIANALGEIATAKAAARQGTIYIQSSLSNTLLEDVAEATRGSVKWFQMYVNKNYTINKLFIDRVEKAGFQAIVLTFDDPVSTYVRNNHFKDFGSIYKASLPNYEILGLQFSGEVFGPAVTLDDLKWFVNNTKLPVVAKGILTKEGALRVKEAGCKGVIVSNHGGRQLDSVPASIEALPEVVAAVGDSLTVMLDSGIRGGPDVFKSLAKGAKCVFGGTSVLWGLTVDGENGVFEVLKLIRTEFEKVLGLAGFPTLASITRNSVVHEHYYEKLSD
ncbi:HAO1.2 family protein [Megaselia abdita]